MNSISYGSCRIQPTELEEMVETPAYHDCFLGEGGELRGAVVIYNTIVIRDMGDKGGNEK